MKYLILSLLLVLMFTLAAGPILAEDDATSSTKPFPLKIKDRIENRLNNKLEKRSVKIEVKLENRLEKLDKVKRQAAERVRKSLLAHWKVLNKAVERSDNLLGKLQERIDKAKVAGKDTAEAEKLIGEAKEKLASAKLKLEEIKDLKDNSITKEEFTEIRGKIKEIGQDLRVVRHNAAKIIYIILSNKFQLTSG